MAMDEILTDRPTLNRRLFLRSGLASLSGFYLAPMLAPLNVRADTPLKLRGQAEFCVFLFLRGGPSQLDTFDLKEGRWTPPDFDVRKTKGILMPYGLFPGISQQLDRFAIARSVQSWESSHIRGVYYLQAGHPMSPARQKEIPSIGAVVAYEYLSRRRAGDFLPPFVTVNADSAALVKEGCLAQGATPMTLSTGGDSSFLIPDKDRADFDRRWKLLEQLNAGKAGSSLKTADNWLSYSDGADRLMTNPAVGQIMRIESDDHKRYGNSALGDGCVLARNLLKANAGTHYIMIEHSAWDSHSNMFDRKDRDNHYTVCNQLDSAVSSLVSDLSQIPSADGKSTLLDKTFVVCAGEFGRTGGELNVTKGRDHNRMAQSVLFAGAGVKGGRAFGQTDDRGEKVIKPEWHLDRPIYTEDIFATIYSQMGIDWNKTITNTPSGRVFEYLEGASGTAFLDPSEISVLFS